MSMPQRMVRRLERAEALDRVAKPVSKATQWAVKPRIIRNLLSGTYAGHPAHPPLTDVTVGAWCMSALLDAAGGRDTEMASDILVATGVISAVPTALTGLNDWSDTIGGDRRVGFVHAAANTTALSLYVASLVSRARGNRGMGKALGFAGFGMLTVSAYLGGHLAFVKGVNVNRTAWQEGPVEWTPTITEDSLAEGDHRTVDAGGVRVLLHKMDGKVYGIAATCSHMGGPLGDGTFEHGCVTCPWHGSTFRFSDGGIERGPASSPQPCYETRIEGGRIEVRIAPAGLPGGADEARLRRASRRIPVHTP